MRGLTVVQLQVLLMLIGYAVGLLTAHLDWLGLGLGFVVGGAVVFTIEERRKR